MAVAVAALVVCFIAYPPAAVLRWWDPSSRPELRGMVGAVGAQRMVEGRLSGGFAWGPVSSRTRGSAESLGPRAAIARAELEEAAARHRSAETLAALGVARLAYGDIQPAVEALEAAVALDRRLPFAWSDLSAAYLARSVLPGSAADVPRALEAAEVALTVQRGLPEAQFNRALALERLGRLSQAGAAWRTFASVERSAAWTAEGNRRLADVEKRSAAPSLSGDLQGLREQLLDSVMPRWAERVASGNDGAALLAEAGALSDQLTRGSTDRLASDVVARAVSTRGRSSALVHGHTAYGRARALYTKRRYDEAAIAFDEAIRSLRIAQSPLELSARLYRAFIHYIRPDLPTAQRELLDVLAALRDRSYSSLNGRAQWVLSLIATHGGQYVRATSYCRQAIESFSAAGEPAQVAFMHQLLADNEEWRGEPERGWGDRLIALTQTRREGPLLQSAQAALRMNWPHVAAALQADAAALARSERRTGTLVDALRVQALMYSRIERPAEARTLLDEARSILAKERETSLESLRAEVDLVDAQIPQPDQPQRALDAATRALDYFTSADTIRRLPDVHLARARLHRQLGRVTEARGDLDAALGILQQHGDALPRGPERLAFAESARRIAAEFVSLEIGAQRPAPALIAADRVRSWDLRMPTTSGEPLQDVQRALPGDTSVIYYGIGDTESYVWVLGRASLVHRRLELNRLELERLIDTMREGRTEPAVGERLQRVLIGPIAGSLVGDRVVIVPDGPLHSLAFAQLPGRTARFMAQDYTLSYAPSLAALAAASTRLGGLTGGVRSVVAVGNPWIDPSVLPDLPALPGSAREARDVSRLYPASTVLVERDAGTEGVLGALAAADVLHFAGHAVANSTYAELSQLGLFDRSATALTALAIGKLSFPQLRLAVLAACRGLSDRSSRGQGPMNLARAFLQAGVPTVLANRWLVDDGTAVEFATRFHADYLRSRDAAGALQRTQRSLIESTDPGLREPATWAGWTVIGGIENYGTNSVNHAR